MGPKARQFSPFAIMEIRLLASQGGMAGGELARLFNYTANEMNLILRGKAYGWVQGDTRPDGPVRMYSPDEIHEIRRLRWEKGVTVAEIAKRWKMTTSQASLITRGKSYAWVPMPRLPEDY